MNRPLTALVLIFAMLGVNSTRGGDGKPKAIDGTLWMKQKLAASQNILRGLTSPDYEAIEKNAQAMIALGYLEKWVRANTPGYQIMLKDFEYANRALVSAAREKNLDGATVAYFQLTLSCVNCHKIVRGEGK